MKKINGLKIIVTVMISSIFYTSCDYIAPGSNLMAEEYEFSITRDSLIQTIINFNTTQGVIFKDSTFRTKKYGSPYYYSGIVVDKNHGELYYLGLHKTAPPPALLLISVENIKTGKVFIINEEPANKEEIMRRKAVIKNFEERVLDKLGLTYVHKGNAMNKEY